MTKRKSRPYRVLAVIHEKVSRRKLDRGEKLGAVYSSSGLDTPRAALRTVGGRPWMALRTPALTSVVTARETNTMPEMHVSNRGRPRQSQVPVFLILMSDLHSQVVVGRLASRAEMAQPVEHDQHDRRETRPCIGWPNGPGGVESSISTLLS